jgi:hypothetical protein
MDGTTFQMHWQQTISTVGILALVTALAVPLSSWAETNSAAQGQEATQPSTQELATLQAQARVDSIFSDSSDAMVEGQRCLPARRIRGVNVLDNRTLVFDLGRDENYLVRLKRQCFGLRKNTPISYEVHGSQFCKHDGFRALETWSIGQFVPGPRCSIPSFIPVTDLEKGLVRARVKADQEARVAERKAEKAARRAAKEAAKAVSVPDQQGNDRQDGENA